MISSTLSYASIDCYVGQCGVTVVISSFFFFKQKTAYEMRISDWSSDVCSSDLLVASGATTWHGFAIAIFEQASELGLIESKPTVTPIESAEFSTPAVRPAWSLMDNRGFQRQFGFVLHDRSEESRVGKEGFSTF